MRPWFPRLLVVAGAIQFVVFAVRPFLTYQALALGASLTEVGLVTASFSVVSLFAALPMGRAVDRYGERIFVLVGALVLVVLPVVLIAVRQIWTLALCSTALGLGHLCASVGVQTLIARGAVDQRRDQRFAAFTVVNSMGQLIAPAVAGLIVGGVVLSASADGAGHGDGVYLTAAAVGLLGVVSGVSLVVYPGALADRAATTGTAARSSRSALAEVLRAPSVPVALVASFSTLSAIDLLAAYLPAYAESAAIPVRTVGFLLAVHGLASVAVRLFMGRLLARYARPSLLAVSMGVSAAALAALPFVAWLPGLYAIMVVTGLGLGLCQPLTVSWVAGQVPMEIRGMAMSVRLAGNRLGQVVVPLGVGLLAGAAGVASAFVAPAALLAAGGWLVTRNPPRTR